MCTFLLSHKKRLVSNPCAQKEEVETTYLIFLAGQPTLKSILEVMFQKIMTNHSSLGCLILFSPITSLK